MIVMGVPETCKQVQSDSVLHLTGVFAFDNPAIFQSIIMGREAGSMLYESIAGYYDKIFPLNRDMVSFLARYIDRTDHVLDIGCGTATLTHAIAKHCRTITGIDPSDAMIRTARSRFPELTLMTAGVFDIPLQRFDTIFCTGNTVSYFSPADLERLAAHVVALLPAGGLWIYQTVNWDFLSRHDHYEFPPVRFDQGVFLRRYEFQSTTEVDFHLKVRVPGRPDIRETHRLYRLTRDHHRSVHQRSGFEQVDCFGSWNGQTWTPDQPGATILLFRKAAADGS